MRQVVARILVRLVLVAGSLYGLLFALAYLTSMHPDPVEVVPVFCDEGVERMEPGHALRVLSWNVQYMAGKGYVFFYDLADGSGPDTVVANEIVHHTLDEVARIIVDSGADLILLQEIDEGSSRTGYIDQLRELLDRLAPQAYCRAEAFYWRARFVPHPKILGSVGMKLVTLSRFRMESASRIALPRMQAEPIYRQLYFHRALLETRLPLTDGSNVVAINTHFDAFGMGTDLMSRQVATTAERLREISDETALWLLGGDLNLLPPGVEVGSLHPDDRSSFSSAAELSPLFAEFRSLPSQQDVTGPYRESFFTSFPNHPEITAPNKTIDYMFHGPGFAVQSFEVRRRDTLAISDHLPLLATLEISTRKDHDEP